MEFQIKVYPTGIIVNSYNTTTLAFATFSCQTIAEAMAWIIPQGGSTFQIWGSSGQNIALNYYPQEEFPTNVPHA